MDKVYAPANLEAALQRVRRNKGAAGVDRVTVRHYAHHAEKNLDRLYSALRDDFVILCRTLEDAREAHARVEEWMKGNGLTLHPDKTRVVNHHEEGFAFLGYHFHTRPGKKWPSRTSKSKLNDKIRPRTRRCNGHSLSGIVQRLNPILRGWFDYFKHSDPQDLKEMEGYVRGRLRAILRKRSKRRGRARGKDHQKWPNAYFRTQGLFSLEYAHGRICQSSRK